MRNLGIEFAFGGNINCANANYRNTYSSFSLHQSLLRIYWRLVSPSLQNLIHGTAEKLLFKKFSNLLLSLSWGLAPLQKSFEISFYFLMIFIFWWFSNYGDFPVIKAFFGNRTLNTSIMPYAILSDLVRWTFRKHLVKTVKFWSWKAEIQNFHCIKVFTGWNTTSSTLMATCVTLTRPHWLFTG